jgi:chlorobactene glucosyltransferase
MVIDLSLTHHIFNGMFMLCLIFLALIGAWVYLLVISIRSYLLTPSISAKKSVASDTNSTSENSYPFVSIIVPARNEQNNIERCLLSLLSQNYPNFEVIVIDDNSTDDTLRIIKKIRNEIRTGPLKDRFEIITLSEKPKDWAGKSWACERGYLRSRGDILLFTDADTYYNNKSILFLAVSYMKKECLDVLTGNPHTELPDFWSKVSMPLWNHFTIILGADTAAVNNPRSNMAYLVGSFFMIYRSVLEKVEGFSRIRNAIHEDVALGVQIKRAGYNIKVVKLGVLVSALWSRDLPTLWHGIARTLTPMSKSLVITHFLVIFFMTLIPFLILPYTLSISLADHPINLMLLLINVVCCLIIIVGTALKNIRKYKISPVYSILVLIGAVLIMAAYIVNMTSLLRPSKTKLVPWRGRKLVYKRKKRAPEYKNTF